MYQLANPQSPTWRHSDATHIGHVTDTKGGRWEVFNCDHFQEQAVERSSYEAAVDIFATEIDLLLADAMLLSALLRESQTRQRVDGMWQRKLNRIQTIDDENKGHSFIFELDAATREVFLVTIMTPERTARVNQKRNCVVINFSQNLNGFSYVDIGKLVEGRRVIVSHGTVDADDLHYWG